MDRCGNGGLDWVEVRPLIESAFVELPDVQAIVFEPVGAPVAELLTGDNYLTFFLRVECPRSPN